MTGTLSVEQRRHLLSSAGVWLGKIEMINARARHSNAEFNKRTSLKPEEREDYENKRREVERILINSLRELYPPEIANDAFIDLTGPTALDLHQIILALEHLSQALKYLHPTFEPSATGAARRFLTEWQRIEKIRDGLEHEEEYLAGRGKFKDMPDPNWKPPIVGYSRWTETDAEGLVSITVLGRSYSIKDCISSALDLRPHLAAERRQII
jgi:hypothetical protein